MQKNKIKERRENVMEDINKNGTEIMEEDFYNELIKYLIKNHRDFPFKIRINWLPQDQTDYYDYEIQIVTDQTGYEWNKQIKRENYDTLFDVFYDRMQDKSVREYICTNIWEPIRNLIGKQNSDGIKIMDYDEFIKDTHMDIQRFYPYFSIFVRLKNKNGYKLMSYIISIIVQKLYELMQFIVKNDLILQKYYIMKLQETNWKKMYNSIFDNDKIRKVFSQYVNEFVVYNSLEEPEEVQYNNDDEEEILY